MNPEDFAKCYYFVIDDNKINKTNISNDTSKPWEQFRTAKEVNATYSIKGEFTYFTGDGFTLDLDPSMSIESYREKMKSVRDIFFSESARGIIVLFTFYSLATDWWIHVLLHYEYGING